MARRKRPAGGVSPAEHRTARAPCLCVTVRVQGTGGLERAGLSGQGDLDHVYFPKELKP